MSVIPGANTPANRGTPKSKTGQRVRPSVATPYASSVEEVEDPKPRKSMTNSRKVRTSRGAAQNINGYPKYSHDQIFAMLKQREVTVIGKVNVHTKKWCPFCLSVQTNVKTHVTTHFDLPKLPEAETELLKREIRALVARWKKMAFPGNMAGFHESAKWLQHCKSVDAAEAYVDSLYEQYNYLVPFTIPSLQDRPNKHIVREEEIRVYVACIKPKEDVVRETQSNEGLGQYTSLETYAATAISNITPINDLALFSQSDTPTKSPMKRTVADVIDSTPKKRVQKVLAINPSESSQHQVPRNEDTLQPEVEEKMTRNHQSVIEYAKKIKVKGELAYPSVQSRMMAWKNIVEELPYMSEEQRTEYLEGLKLPSVDHLCRVTGDANEFVHCCAAEFYPHLAIKDPSGRPAHMRHLGYGVKTNMALNKGTFICEYKGKVFARDEAVIERAYATACGTSRHAYAAKIQHKRHRTIQGCIAKFLASNNITVADTRMVTFGALVNNSAKHPNCRMVRIDDKVYGRGKIWCLQALRPIGVGEELLWDHGTERFNQHNEPTKICPCCYCVGHCWCDACKGQALHGQRKLDTVDAMLDMYVGQGDGGGKMITVSKCGGIHVALSASIPNDRTEPSHLSDSPHIMKGMEKMSFLLRGEKRDKDGEPLQGKAFQEKLHKYMQTMSKSESFSPYVWSEILSKTNMVNKGGLFDRNIHQGIFAALRTSDHPMVLISAEGKEDLSELVHTQTNFYRGREPTTQEVAVPPKGWLIVRLTAGDNKGYHAVYGLHNRANSKEDGVYQVPFTI